MIDPQDLDTLAAARLVLDELRSNNHGAALGGKAHCAHDNILSVLIDLKVWHDEPVTDAQLGLSAEHSVKA